MMRDIIGTAVAVVDVVKIYAQSEGSIERLLFGFASAKKDSQP